MGAIFLKTFVILAALMLFAVPGLVLKKLNMLGDGAKTTLGNILLYVCQPALIISSFTVFSDADYETIRSYDRVALLADFGVAAAVSTVAILAMFALCKAVFVRYKDRPAADVYTFIAMFSNCGFLGVPFVEMFTDGNAVAVLYVMVFNLVFAVLAWTLGVYLITHDAHDISPKKVLLNPTVIATAVAVVMFFVPEINFFMIDGCKELGTVPSALGTMTAPISMILVGVALAELPVRSLFDKSGIYVAGALRLVVAPLVTFGIAVAFKYMTAGGVAAHPDGEYVFLAPVLAMCMSPAAIIVAMTERFGKARELAAAAYVSDTLFSLVSVPLMVLCVTELWKFVA
ncbi:MAG: hypothetical protein HFJ21_01150 [Clostridia bacterium]|mgnify:FL=1|nr:hypothetical protein [Clostridia bacterium]